jgi:hypothetical protein
MATKEILLYKDGTLIAVPTGYDFNNLNTIVEQERLVLYMGKSHWGESYKPLNSF